MPFYKCDELTPNLCELKEEVGQVDVNGIQVTYYKFTKAAAAAAAASEEAKKGKRELLPIVAIHGGPSVAHNYMLPLKQQACLGRMIVFYDQAGCGRSRPNGVVDFNVNDYPWLLDPLYYSTVELPAVLRSSVLKNDDEEPKGFHIVANSWGTMLSQLYALEAKDETRKRLASMVLSGPLSDSKKYVEAQWDQEDGSVGSLPPFIQQRIHALEKDRAFDSEEFKTINDILTGFFTIRTQPAPDCWIDAGNQANMEIYRAMQGPSEFGMSGVLEDFNVTGRLHEVEVPVLLSHGKYDTMRPSIVNKMKEVLPNAETLFLTKSGHISMIDEPGLMNARVADFYDRVEASYTSDLEGVARVQPMELLQAGQTTQSSSWSVSFSMFMVSSLLAMMLGYFVGQYQEQRRRSNRPQYTSISDCYE